MAKVIETIVISSGEETDDIDTKEISDKNDVIDLTASPNYRLSTSKLLKLRKSRKERSRLRSTTHMHNNVTATQGTESPKESPIKSAPSISPKLLQIDRTKLKQLRAVVRIQLERSPNTRRLIKKEIKSDDEMDTLPKGIPSPPQNQATKKIYPSPCKASPTQKNVLQYLKSSPKRNLLEDAFDKMTLSPSKTKTTPQKTQSTPQKSQSTLEHWVTPTKKMRKQIPTTPSQDVTAKRNELVWPPQNVILNTDKFIKRLYKNPREFPTTYKYIVESLQDEELHITVVKTIGSFISRDFAPSPEIIWYLVNNILSKSSNSWLISLTYSLLNDIIEKYPSKCVAMNITLEHVRKHFFQEKVSNGKKSLKAKSCNKLALSFLLSILSVELKATALKSKQRRLTKYFAADFDVRHVRDVIPHLKKCLENHTVTPSSCGIGERRDLPEETSICGLELFQDLLKLFMIVSLSKENAAIKLADQLMYLYIELPTLQQRVLLLQSVKSHHVRQHLIKVLLMNYCSLLPEALKSHDILLCMRKIIFQDFYREPPNRSDEYGHSAEDVEEYITLLAYLLQSYVAIHNPRLHGYHNDHPLCDHDGIREFSQEDLGYLQDLNHHVLHLGMRCSRFLRKGQRLSLRTNLLLHMMAVEL